MPNITTTSACHVRSALSAPDEEGQPPTRLSVRTQAAPQSCDRWETLLQGEKALSELTDPIHWIVTQTSVPAKRTQQELLKCRGYWRALEIRSSYLKGSSFLHNSQTTSATVQNENDTEDSVSFCQASHRLITQSLSKALAAPNVWAIHYWPHIENSPPSTTPTSPQWNIIPASVIQQKQSKHFKDSSRSALHSSHTRERTFSKGMTTPTSPPSFS